MRKFGRAIVILSLLIILGVVSTIVFLTIPEERLDTTVFWLAFSFAVPWVFLTAFALHLYVGSKAGAGEVTSAVIYYLVCVFAIIYLAVGLIFMYLPITKTTLLIIIETVVSALYFIAAMYFVFGTKYLSEDRKEVKSKVLFIRLLKSDIDACTLKTTNGDILAALNALSSDVRFSDPMSHPSLAGMEGEMTGLVSAISNMLSGKQEEGVLDLIAKVSALLKMRNERCKILK
jgi:hypothetical protein